MDMEKCHLGSDPDSLMLFALSPWNEVYDGKCTIPSSKPILVPLLIGECDGTVSQKIAKSQDITELWKCASQGEKGLRSWEVSLDGKELLKKDESGAVNPDLMDKILVRNSSMFTITYPEVNRYEVDPGSYKGVVFGYYLILKPLSPGQHVLRYQIDHEEELLDIDNPVVGNNVYFLNAK